MMSVSVKNGFLHLEEAERLKFRKSNSFPAIYFDHGVEKDFSIQSLSTSCSSFSSTSSSDESVRFQVSRRLTTVMIRNIPCKYTQEHVMEEVSAISPNFDFLYMPPARRDGGSKGYAFVNFYDPETAYKFILAFQGHVFHRQPNSLKRADVGYAEVQGLTKNVKFYKRCKAMKSKFTPFIQTKKNRS